MNAEYQLETISADSRLVGLTDDDSGQFTRLTLDVAYRCAACNTRTQFDVRQKSSQAARLRRFAEVMGSLTPYEEDYCDFDCSGCGEHVRLVYALTEVSMARYEYYPRTIHICPATDGFAMQAPPQTKVKRPAWLYWLLGCALVVFIWLINRVN